MSVTILKGDCRDLLREVPDESVHCVVTSPPYYGLRDYGVDGQIGLEASYIDFIDAMRKVVRDRYTKAHEYLFLFAKGQWKSRIVQFSDLTGECVHFGRYISTNKSSFREPITKFCIRLATALFDGAQRQNDFGLPPFYAQEWKQLANGNGGELICNHPSVARLAAVSACFLNSDFTTKEFLQHLNSLWINLSTSKHAGVPSNPALSHCRIFGVKFDQGGVATEPVGDKTSRASAAKWVEDGAAHGFGIAGAGRQPAKC